MIVGDADVAADVSDDVSKPSQQMTVSAADVAADVADDVSFDPT